MSDVRSVFVLAPDADPEIVLFAASIGRSLSRGNDVHIVEDEPDELFSRDPSLAKLRLSPLEIAPDRARLIMCGESDLLPGRGFLTVWRLSVVDDKAPTVRLETGTRRFDFPLAMSSAILRTFGRSLAEVPRVLVSLGHADARRERMVMRVCEELAGRRWPHVVVVLGHIEGARRLSADECYPQPGAFELTQLIASSTVIVDPVEGDEAPAWSSCLGSSVGIPVVSHSTGLLARRKYGDVRSVEDWSPDAFAEAVMEAARAATGDLSWDAEFDAVAEDFGRIIQSA